MEWFKEMMLFIKDWWFIVSALIGMCIGAYKGVMLINATLQEIKYELKSWTFRMDNSENKIANIYVELKDNDNRIDDHERRIYAIERGGK